MEVVFSILFVITIIVAILVLWPLFLLYSASKDDYPDIKDFQRKCPKCQDVWYQRIYRKWWMRLMPGTKYYRCNRCRSKFVIIFWRSALEIS